MTSSKKIQRFETGVEGFNAGVVSSPGAALEWLVEQEDVDSRCYWALPGNTLCLAGIGVAEMIQGDGALPRRVYRRASRLPEGAFFIGGQRFDCDADQSEDWKPLAGHCMILPRIVLEEHQDKRLVLACHCTADEMTETSRLLDRVSTTRKRHVKRYQSLLSPKGEKDTVPSRSDWEAMVESFLRAKIEKVVPARRRMYQTDMTTPINPWSVMAGLERQVGTRDHCYRFGLEVPGGTTFFGASPELLCEIDAKNLSLRSDVLAGTRPRIHSDANKDEALGLELLASAKDALENDIVTQFVQNRLDNTLVEALCVSGIHLIKLATVQHLRRQVSARLKPRISISAVLKALHPTPATLGSPRNEAKNFLRTHESFDRGWFAGPFGTLGTSAHKKTDATFAVAIRSALVSSSSSQHTQKIFAYAGAGLVTGSDPQLEAEEVDAKLKPMHDALLGYNFYEKNSIYPESASAAAAAAFKQNTAAFISPPKTTISSPNASALKRDPKHREQKEDLFIAAGAS